MRLYFFLLLSFIIIGNDALLADTVELLQDADGCFRTLALDDLSEIIRTEKIYDPRVVGLSPNNWASDSKNMHLLIFFHLDQLSGFFQKIRNELYSFDRDENDNLEAYEKKRKYHFLDRRRTFTENCIRLHVFFAETIDKECWKTNTFLKVGVINTPFPVSNIMQDKERMDASERYFELLLKDIKKQLPVQLKPEYEKLKNRFDNETKILHDEQKKWVLEKLEYNLQSGLLQLQQETLKDTHKLLVELYSLEPRADTELLELIKDSQYPEREKVRILMELGIAYKNYRVWESTDGLFKTNAKFISLDKREVTLEKPDGKQTTIELSALRKEDQDYVKEQLAPKPESPKTDSSP